MQEMETYRILYSAQEFVETKSGKNFWGENPGAEKKKRIPLPGIEPGPAGWEPAILTTRP